MKRWIAVVILVGIAVYGVYYYINRPMADTSDQDADFTLTAAELFSAFETDENAANTRYVGKVIEIQGPVSGVDVASHTVSIDAGSEMFGINCEISPDYANELQVLKPGDTVVIKGECAGYQMDVLLMRSSLRKK